MDFKNIQTTLLSRQEDLKMNLNSSRPQKSFVNQVFSIGHRYDKGVV
jgi:hypothetical protein